MSAIAISVNVPKLKKNVEFTLDIGDSLQEMIERYGEAVVYRLAFEKAKTGAMNIARNALSRGKTEEEVRLLLEQEWTPIRRARNVFDIDITEVTAEELAELSDI